jgi:hypothetical protein
MKLYEKRKKYGKSGNQMALQPPRFKENHLIQKSFQEDKHMGIMHHL